MRYRRTLLAIIASTALVHAASAQQKPDKVVIGYLNLVNAQLVTKALGLHEKEMGVPIEWVKFGSGGDVNRAVAANQLSFGGVGNPPATIGIGRGLAYRGIFVLNMLGPVESLVVRTSKQIEKPQDLVGKSAAAPFGSTTHYLIIVYLRGAGVLRSSFSTWRRATLSPPGFGATSMLPTCGSLRSTRWWPTAAGSSWTAGRWPRAAIRRGTSLSSWTISQPSTPITSPSS